ncbi:MAG TPA: condensation domain-containing protein, partial [Terriglobales bacterium]|nr:condensation domain-containing protein [Terriglobales bacterium]
MSSTTSDRGQGTGDSPFTPPDAALMFPVSFQQRRLWFLDQLDPGSSTYNITWSLRMRGVLNPEALQASINEIVRRHEILRTTFPTHDGEPVQLIHPKITVDLPLVDLGNILEARREAEAQRIVSAEAKRPMNLARGPLVRASLLRLAEQDHVLVLSTHHIVFDGWSRMILIRELAALYDAFASGRELALPPLRLQYADFAVWQREQLLGETLNRQLSYWKQQLTGAPANLDLPTDRPRPAVQSYQGANTSVTLPRELTEALHRLSKEESVTLFMTLLAGFQALLCRYCAQDDVVVGIPMANRTQPELEELIGFFANTLALRTDLTGNPTFRELLARVKEVALGAYANQDMPFEKLVEELRPERSVSHNPIFQVLFSLQNAPRRAFELKGLALTPLDSHSGMAKFDLSLFMHETPEGLVARAEFNTDLFNASTINRMLGHFRVILEAATEDPELRLAQLPLLTESERDQLLFQWNSTHRNFPADKCLHQLFESQAESKPDQVAVTFA